MKYILILHASFIATVAFGQPKHLDVQSDTSFWFALKQKDMAHIGLPDLTKSTDSLHFRYWMENHAVDIWSNDGSTFFGIISVHTESIISDKTGNSKAGKYYSAKENLTALEARSIFELFIQAGVFKWPTGDSIKGWGSGFDGAEFLLEYSTKSTYAFKAYWTPSAEKGVPEADTLDELNSKLGELLRLNERWRVFIKHLPDGCYSEGEMMQVCKVANARRRPIIH